MEQKWKPFILMVLMTCATLGISLLAYIHRAPMIGVLVSFSNLVFNYHVHARISPDIHGQGGWLCLSGSLILLWALLYRQGRHFQSLMVLVVMRCVLILWFLD